MYGWEGIEPRFDATKAGYANEPHRFGYIVEIDPYDPSSTPRKHTAMGRFKHEGANIRVGQDGTVVAYMGDDERFDYLYKFVAKRSTGRDLHPARRHNLRLLTEGDLYVARFSGTQRPDGANLGRGVWLPLVLDGESMVRGMSVEEVLVFTRQAADAVKATPMDRCEDVEPSPTNGKVYVACTNNTQRGATAGKPGADAANPRSGGENKYGHVIEITEHRNRADATTFSWNILLLCGDPAADRVTTYFAGWDGPVAPISCPDNVVFDRDGNLWISTDGAPGTISKADGLFKVPLEGEERGHVQQFLAVPAGRGDLRARHPRHRRLGVRGRPAPGRGRHLGRAALLLPRLRGRRPPPGPRRLARSATIGRAGDQEEALTAAPHGGELIGFASVSGIWPFWRVMNGGLGSGGGVVRVDYFTPSGCPVRQRRRRADKSSGGPSSPAPSTARCTPSARRRHRGRPDGRAAWSPASHCVPTGRSG